MTVVSCAGCNKKSPTRASLQDRLHSKGENRKDVCGWLQTSSRLWLRLPCSPGLPLYNGDNDNWARTYSSGTKQTGIVGIIGKPVAKV